jgi:large subunit ribosomal protein L24
MGQPGGIVEREPSVHLSNLALLGADGKPTKVSFRVIDGGKKIRVARKSGAAIDA